MGVRNWRRESRDRDEWRTIWEEAEVHPKTVMPEEEEDHEVNLQFIKFALEQTTKALRA